MTGAEAIGCAEQVGVDRLVLERMRSIVTAGEQVGYMPSSGSVDLKGLVREAEQVLRALDKVRCWSMDEKDN